MKVYVLRTQYWIPDYHYELLTEDFAAYSSLIGARCAMVDDARDKCQEWKEKNPKTKRYSMNSVVISRGDQEVHYDIYELPVRS